MQREQIKTLRAVGCTKELLFDEPENLLLPLFLFDSSSTMDDINHNAYAFFILDAAHRHKTLIFPPFILSRVGIESINKWLRDIRTWAKHEREIGADFETRQSPLDSLVNQAWGMRGERGHKQEMGYKVYRVLMNEGTWWLPPSARASWLFQKNWIGNGAQDGKEGRCWRSKRINTCNSCTFSSYLDRRVKRERQTGYRFDETRIHSPFKSETNNNDPFIYTLAMTRTTTGK